MERLDKKTIGSIDVFLADSNDELRDDLRSALRAAGFKRIKTFKSVDALSKGLATVSPDLLILSANLGGQAFTLANNIRKAKIGRNPFTLITLLLGQKASLDAVTKALSCGADDVIVGPISPSTLLGRIAHITFHRALFISTSDYLGPERRKAGRKSLIPQLSVLNTMLEKVEGRRISQATFDREVARCSKLALAARLESQWRKLNWACTFILNAYDKRTVDAEIKKYFLILIDVLSGAVASAKALGDTELSKLLTRQIEDVRKLDSRFLDLRRTDLTAIEKLTEAYGLARRSRAKRESRNTD